MLCTGLTRRLFRFASCFCRFNYSNSKLSSFDEGRVHFEFCFVNCNDLLVGSFLLLDLQNSDSIHEVIYLSDDDSRSKGFCQCNALGLPRHIVFALLAVPPCFRLAPPVAPPSPPVDSSRCARAIYMHA